MIGSSGLCGGLAATIRSLIADRRGNVAIISALALPVLLGAFGLGTEVAGWYANQRSMQHAADSAAIAAATNASSTFDVEAKAVASHYGFTDGKDGVVIQAADAVTCPDGKTDCYSVTISKPYPLILAQFVGFHGDTDVNGAPAQKIAAVAVAKQGLQPRPYCLVALGKNGTTIKSDGSPFANLSGCNVLANGDSDCNGHNLKADHGDAAGTNRNCGVSQTSGVNPLDDPYTDLAKNIPPDTCGSYPQASTAPGHSGHGDPSVDTDHQLAGPYIWTSYVPKCGDLQLTGDVTINNGGGPATLVIYNGSLDTNGFKLATADGSQLTIVFAGTNSSSYDHIPTGGGTIDIQAPTEGDWKGVAMYQAPNLTQGVNISAAGNSPTWDITGLVYLPHSSVTFSGAVNKSSHGASCFAMVMNDITINGTGSILAHGGCGDSGILPTNQVPSRGQLVL